ncbi:MAG: hypothetical protein Edafosvirus1_41 [Edafosvirus sp.]|uniref:Uncharacterized protein n=1 Tax=Edafosvirus sp. TaxID=2487765 RepID=A0A3G4ZS41_9VIRU|nr:MAG: hypothetical protein Edafosvirus1_41 [Edafosvirus sp.]
MSIICGECSKKCDNDTVECEDCHYIGLKYHTKCLIEHQKLHIFFWDHDNTTNKKIHSEKKYGDNIIKIRPIDGVMIPLKSSFSYDHEHVYVTDENVIQCCNCLDIFHKNEIWQHICKDKINMNEDIAENICSYCFKGITGKQKKQKITEIKTFPNYIETKLTLKYYIKPHGCDECNEFIENIKSVPRMFMSSFCIHYHYIYINDNKYKMNNRIFVTDKISMLHLVNFFREILIETIHRHLIQLPYYIDGVIFTLKYLNSIEAFDLDSIIYEYRRLWQDENELNAIDPKINYCDNRLKKSFIQLQTKLKNSIKQTNDELIYFIDPLKNIINEYMDCRYAFLLLIENKYYKYLSKLN